MSDGVLSDGVMSAGVLSMWGFVLDWMPFVMRNMHTDIHIDNCHWYLLITNQFTVAVQVNNLQMLI